MNNPEVRLEAPEFADERTPIGFSIVIRNTADAPLELHLQGRETIFDLSVIGDGGRLVWRRLDGQSLQAILRLDTLGPGESITLADVWDQRDLAGQYVDPGFYTLQASVPTDSDPLLSQDRLLHVTR